MTATASRTRAAAAQFRVTCPAFSTAPVRSEERARTQMAELEAAGNCLSTHHTIETRTSAGEWVAVHIAKAREILASRCSTVVDTFDGTLTVVQRHDLHEGPEALLHKAAGDTAAYAAALGPARGAMLTSDARQVDTTAWCDCEPAPEAAAWFRYERWSERGRESHGYGCPTCRRITQTG